MKEGGISGRGNKEREGKRNYKVRELGWGEGGGIKFGKNMEERVSKVELRKTRSDGGERREGFH